MNNDLVRSTNGYRAVDVSWREVFGMVYTLEKTQVLHISARDVLTDYCAWKLLFICSICHILHLSLSYISPELSPDPSFFQCPCSSFVRRP